MFGLFKKKPQPAKLDVSLIVPRIKHTNFLTALRDVGTGADDTPVTEPLVGELLITYAFDLPEMFQMVRPMDCKELGIAHDQLRGIATANLMGMVHGNFKIVGPPPVIKLEIGNDLEACLLLIDEIWQGLGKKMPPELVVGVPARHVLLVASSGSTNGGLQLIQQAVLEAYGKETTHALTKQLLVRRADKWEVFDGAI